MIILTVIAGILSVILTTSILIQKLWWQKQLMPTKGLLLNIEGLRGWLAFSVFVHHALTYRTFYQTGHWTKPTTNLGSLLGSGAVAMFFIITAFLFWGKALDSGGRFDLKRFFEGRFLRLAPLFYVTTAAVLLISLLATGLPAHPLNLLTHLAAWLSVGLLGIPDLNGFNSSHLVVNVPWSLQYEWGFYLLFPLIALLLRVRKLAVLLPFLGSLLLVSDLVHPLPLLHFALLFAAGMCAAWLWRDARFQGLMLSPLAAQALFLLPLGLLLRYHSAYGPVQVLLVLWAFLALLKLPAASMLGRVLHSNISRTIGAASYSIYLLHGLVLYLGTDLLDHFTRFAALPLWGFLLFVAVAAAVVTLLSLNTFRYIEHPFFRRDRVRFGPILRGLLGVRI